MPRPPTRLTARHRAEEASLQRHNLQPRHESTSNDIDGQDQHAVVVVKQERSSRSPSPPRFSADFCDSFRFVSSSSSATLTPKFLRSSVKHEPAARPKRESLKREEAVENDENLPQVPDHIRDHVDILIIGSNPGRMSSQKGQHFGHPSNHFYRALHRAGLTPRQLHPSEDYTMIHQAAPYLSLGLTNLAARPTRLAQQVAKSENAAGAQILVALIKRHRPRLGVFIGIGVAKAFEQSGVSAQKRPKSEHDAAEPVNATQSFVTLDVPTEVPLGSEDELGLGVGMMLMGVRHDAPIPIDDNDSERHSTGTATSTPAFTLLYACPSTSGRVTSHQLPQKAECMRRARVLAEWLRQTPSHHRSCKTVRVQLV